MKVLYLTEDYLDSKVHNNLLIQLLNQREDLEIYVFSPTREEEHHGIEDSYKHSPRLHVYTPKIDISVSSYRINFKAKIQSKLRLIEKNIPIKEINVIHAATMYSEGALALKLKEKYSIPYFITIRGTDVNFYSKYFFHLWKTGIKVIEGADMVLCVTPIIKKRMLEMWKYRKCSNLLKISRVLNNGIDRIWLNNISSHYRKDEKELRVLYIGRFDKNKNVLSLIKAIKTLQQKYNIHLTLVGGNGEEHESVLSQVKSNSSFIEYLGPIYDKEKLMDIVRNSDVFTMVSHSETFGLVYAECLSQGIPIVYTKNTGFDGMYKEGEVGYSVDSNSVESISNGIERTIENYNHLIENIRKIDFTRFSWEKITSIYIYIYMRY